MNHQKRKLLWMTAIAAVFITTFIGACKKDKQEPTPTATNPKVVSTTPSKDAVNVALNQVITVNFDSKMDAATLNSAAFTLTGTSNIGGALTYNAANSTLSFTPATALVINTTYTATVKNTVKDAAGNAMQANYVWTFSTGATLMPSVISTDPLNNASGVAVNKVVAATFNVPMNPSTLNSPATSFTIKQGATAVSGTVVYVGTTAFFTPTVALASNTAYTCTISTGAKNAAGNGLAADYVWSFNTGVVVAPTVISTDPLNNAIGILLDKTISATFSEPMEVSTMTASNFTLKQGLTSIPGVVTYAGSTISFTSTNLLVANTTYTATIGTGAKNPAGTPLANDKVWSFTTKTLTGAQGPDLKSAGNFGILAGISINNNAGFSEIHDMDIGLSPGVRSKITGFPPAIMVNGSIFAADDIAPPGTPAMLIQAKQDLTDAYLFIEGATAPAPATVAGDQGGKTLAPGIYKSTSTLMVQLGDLTLDAQGDPNAIWIFQVASDFTTIGGAGGNIILSGGAQAKNVFWQIGSSATIGVSTIFKGNILALTSITMGSYATLQGRLLAQNGSVVLTSTNIITKP